MDFRVECPCGQRVVVSEAAAESDVHCTCGRSVRVPPLAELRRQAGLPAYNIPPEQLIEHLLAAGELPGTPYCARCTAETSNLVYVIADCERAWKPSTPWYVWPILALGGLFWILVYLIWRREVATVGDNKTFTVPLRICPPCQANLGGQTTLRRCLRTVPAYERLLDKFPDAQLRLAE